MTNEMSGWNDLKKAEQQLQLCTELIPVIVFEAVHARNREKKECTIDHHRYVMTVKAAEKKPMLVMQSEVRSRHTNGKIIIRPTVIALKFVHTRNRKQKSVQEAIMYI